MSTDELAARASVLYAQRLGSVSLTADKTWVASIDIDADACSEATYESDFSGESLAASVGSSLTVLAAALPPRTENAQAKYADHGIVRDASGDVSAALKNHGAAAPTTLAGGDSLPPAAPPAPQASPVGSPVGLVDAGGVESAPATSHVLACASRTLRGAPPLASQGAAVEEKHWVVVEPAQAASQTFRPCGGGAWAPVAGVATDGSQRGAAALAPPAPPCPPSDAAVADAPLTHLALRAGAEWARACGPESASEAVTPFPAAAAASAPPSGGQAPAHELAALHFDASVASPLPAPDFQLAGGSALLGPLPPQHSPRLQAASPSPQHGGRRPPSAVSLPYAAAPPSIPLSPPVLLSHRSHSRLGHSSSGGGHYGSWVSGAASSAGGGGPPSRAFTPLPPVGESASAVGIVDPAETPDTPAVARVDSAASLQLLLPAHAHPPPQPSPASPPPGTIRPPTAARRQSPGPVAPQPDAAVARVRSSGGSRIVFSQPAAAALPPPQPQQLAPQAAESSSDSAQPLSSPSSVVPSQRPHIHQSPPRSAAARGESAFNSLFATSLAPPSLAPPFGTTGGAFGIALPGSPSASAAVAAASAAPPVTPQTARHMLRDAGPIRVFDIGLGSAAAPAPHFAVTSPGGAPAARQARAGSATPPRPPSRGSQQQQQHQQQQTQQQQQQQHSPPSPAASGQAFSGGAGAGSESDEPAPAAAPLGGFVDLGVNAAAQLSLHQHHQPHHHARSASASSAAFFAQLQQGAPGRPPSAAPPASSAGPSASAGGAVSADARPAAPGLSSMGSPPPYSPALTGIDTPLAPAAAAAAAHPAPVAPPAAMPHTAITKLQPLASVAAAAAAAGGVAGRGGVRHGRRAAAAPAAPPVPSSGGAASAFRATAQRPSSP